MPVQTETFVETEGRHHLVPSALPDCMIPDFLSSEDVTGFVERAIAQRQVVRSFRKAAEIDEANRERYSGWPGQMASIALQGYNVSLQALNLFTPLTGTETGWHEIVEDLTTVAVEQSIDLAHELNI